MGPRPHFVCLFVCFKGGMGTGLALVPPLPDKRVRVRRRSPELRVPSALLKLFRDPDNPQYFKG